MGEFFCVKCDQAKDSHEVMCYDFDQENGTLICEPCVWELKETYNLTDDHVEALITLESFEFFMGMLEAAYQKGRGDIVNEAVNHFKHELKHIVKKVDPVE